MGTKSRNRGRLYGALAAAVCAAAQPVVADAQDAAIGRIEAIERQIRGLQSELQRLTTSTPGCGFCVPLLRNLPRLTSSNAPRGSSASWRKGLVELGRLLRDWAQSTKRWRDPSAMKTAGALPSCCASRASFFYCRTPPEPRRRRITSGRRSNWAHRQGALSWELRTASSLARLWRDQYRVGEARAAEFGLRPLHRRFRDGRPATSEKLAGATGISSCNFFGLDASL